jgi:hypothetical protein
VEWAFPVLSALASGVAAYLLGRRRSSGRVEVSDADAIFAEATAFRGALMQRIHDLETDLHDERVEQGRLRHELRQELHACQMELAQYKRGG